MLVATTFNTIGEANFEEFTKQENLKFVDGDKETFISNLGLLKRLDGKLYLDRSANIAVLESADFYISVKNLPAILSHEFKFLCDTYDYDTACTHLSFLISKTFNLLIYCYSQGKSIEWHEPDPIEIDSTVLNRINFFLSKNKELADTLIKEFGLIV